MFKYKRTWYEPSFRGTEDAECVQDVVSLLLACVSTKKETAAATTVKNHLRTNYITEESGLA